MTTEDFVRLVYPAACRSSAKSGISPLFITAQAALESGWGRRRIGRWNLFGITRGSWTGPCVAVETTEYFRRPDVRFSPPEEVLSVERLDDGRYRYRVRRLFRDYPTLEAAIDDHCAVLRGSGFADAWPHRADPEAFVERLQDSVGSRYATSPDYVDVMRRMFATVARLLRKTGLDSAAE
ncbi:MAG: glucosaminidase domain-containing protein [Alistipes sp.]|nr:glucosaminidase domain-containing protein [Alistipes sp.]MDE6777933.1 glucosaminidase domain-containing protein [Alistipes sp.]